MHANVAFPSFCTQSLAAERNYANCGGGAYGKSVANGCDRTATKTHERRRKRKKSICQLSALSHHFCRRQDIIIIYGLISVWKRCTATAHGTFETIVAERMCFELLINRHTATWKVNADSNCTCYVSECWWFDFSVDVRLFGNSKCLHKFVCLSGRDSEIGQTVGQTNHNLQSHFIFRYDEMCVCRIVSLIAVIHFERKKKNRERNGINRSCVVAHYLCNGLPRSTCSRFVSVIYLRSRRRTEPNPYSNASINPIVELFHGRAFLFSSLILPHAFISMVKCKSMWCEVRLYVLCRFWNAFHVRSTYVE